MIFELALERVRQPYVLCIYGYVVMPEHVHLLVSEPEQSDLAHAMQSLKQGVSRTLALRAAESFWQARYYDPSASSGFRQRAQTPATRLNFNVWNERKFVQKLRYIHRSPVTRGLVDHPEDWDWSSFRHYLTGERGVVEIESQWTARLRESAGIFPTVKVRTDENPRPSEAWTGHPSE